MIPTQEDLQKLSNYDLQPLSGGAVPIECAGTTLICGASLDDNTLSQVVQQCSPPLFDVDGDGVGEYVLDVDWSTNTLVTLKYDDSSSSWKVQCYSLSEKSAFSLPSLPLPNIDLNALFANIANYLKTALTNPTIMMALALILILVLGEDRGLIVIALILVIAISNGWLKLPLPTGG